MFHLGFTVHSRQFTVLGGRLPIEGIASLCGMSYNPGVQDCRKLKAWRAARALVPSVYRLTTGFPSTERFGSSQQMRRAAVSISSNIAEGCGRGSQRELIRFLRIASGSAHELESQLQVAVDLDFCSDSSEAGVAEQIRNIKAMLAGLEAAIRASVDSH